MASATPGRIPVWAVPLSLAATDGIDVSLFSCGYLDVSVPRVRSYSPMHSASSNAVLPALCFHIQKSPDQCLFASFPELIAGCRVFLRLSMPRHPPYTLGKLDLLDRGSISSAMQAEARTTNKSIPSQERSTSPTGARAMPAQTERPKKRSFKSRHRRSHLFLLGPRI